MPLLSFEKCQVVDGRANGHPFYGCLDSACRDSCDFSLDIGQQRERTRPDFVQYFYCHGEGVRIGIDTQARICLEDVYGLALAELECFGLDAEADVVTPV